MDRGTMPSPEETASAAAAVIAAGKRAAAGLRPGTGPEEAALAVQAAVARLWPAVTPEAALDVMTGCAAAVVARGITRVPGRCRPAAMTADDMVDLTAQWQAGGSPAPPAGRLAPPAAYASATALEPAEDGETLEAVCLLIALAYPPQTGT